MLLILPTAVSCSKILFLFAATERLVSNIKTKKNNFSPRAPKHFLSMIPTVIISLMLDYQFSPVCLSQCVSEKNKIVLRISQLRNATTFMFREMLSK